MTSSFCGLRRRVCHRRSARGLAPTRQVADFQNFFVAFETVFRMIMGDWDVDEVLSSVMEPNGTECNVMIMGDWGVIEGVCDGSVVQSND